MANLTLRVEDRLLAEARKVAAARETTVSRMVREFLRQETRAAEEEAARARALAALLEALDACRSSRPVPPLNRAQLHEG